MNPEKKDYFRSQFDLFNALEISRPMLYFNPSSKSRIKSSWAKSNAYFLVLLFFCQFSAFAQCFLPSVQLNPSTTNRKSITVGDFDRNGNLDFVTANNLGGNISFFKGNGNGTFNGPTQFTVGTTPFFIGSADLNNDGWLDVFTANSGNSTFSVLLNNQIGGFASATNFATASQPYAIATGDFNNDSKLDIAVANYGSNSLSIRLGNGLGGFGGSVSVSTSFFGASNPSSIISNDFDRDGNADLAVTMFTGNRVLIFLGNGSGVFATSPTSYSVGARPISVIAQDLNSDGFLDVAVANQNTPFSISVLLGTVNAPFLAAQTTYVANTSPSSIASGDFNGDGILDLACAQSGSASMAVFRGTGSGAFLPRTDFASNVGAQPQSIAAGDFNNDLRLDIATANNAAANADKGISIFLNNTPALPSVTVVQPSCPVPIATISVMVQNLGDSYSFDNGSSYQANNVFNPTLLGTYTVIIKNSNGCLSPALPVVIDPLPPSPLQPTIANVVQPTCSAPNGTISVMVQNVSDSYSFDNGSSYQASNVFNPTLPGTYTVITKNSNGCLSPAVPVEIDPLPAPPQPTIANVVQPDCDNTNGSFELVVQEITDEYSIGGVTFQTSNIFSGLTSGSFSVIVKNQQGCKSLSTVVTLQVTGTLIAPTPAPPTQPTCLINSGTIEVPVQNPDDTFSFNGGVTFQTSNRASGLAAGNYGVQLKNKFGCLSSIVSVTIDPLKPIPATPVVTTPVVDCVISIVVSEQFSADLYSRNGTSFQTSTTFTNITPGTYAISIKNSAGCIASSQLVVSPISGAPLAPTFTSITQPTCTTPLGAVEVNPPTTDPYTYSFDNGASFQTSNLNSTLNPRGQPYLVVIKNDDGCTSPASPVTIINSKPSFTLRAFNGSDINGTTTTTCDQLNPDILFRAENNATNVRYFWTVSDRSNISGAVSLPSAEAIEATSLNLSLTSLDRQNQGFVKYTFRAISGTCETDENEARTVTIAVNPTPVLVSRQNGNVVPSGSSLTICSSEGLLLNFSNSFNVPNTSYSWITQNVTNVSNAGSGASSSLNQSLVSATGNTPGSISYIINASANGCSSAATTINVNVNPVPTLQTNGNSQTFCEGNSTNITLSNPNSVNNTGYVWSSLANGLSGATNQVTPINSTSIQDLLILDSPNSAAAVDYSIRAIASGCSSALRTFTISVNPVPVLVVKQNSNSIASNSSLAICSSSGLLLDFSNTFDIPTTTYSWVTQSVANVSNSVAGTNNSLNQLLTCSDGSNPGSLSYIIRANSNGCLSSASTINVNVKPVPLLQTNGNSQTLCDTNPTNINLTNPNSVSNTGYVWTSTPSGLSGATNQSIPTSLTNIQDLLVLNSPSNAATVDYSIQAIADGCVSATQLVSVTLNPIPDIAVNAPLKICNGNNLTISLSRNVKNIANTFYEWRWVTPSSNLAVASETSGSTFGAIQQVLNLTNNNNGSANLTYEIKPRTALCIGTAVTTQVTVNPNPTLTINPSFGLCSNAVFTFPLISLGGAPAKSYSWNLLTVNNVSNVNLLREGATLVETLNSTDGINSGTAIYEIRSISAEDCISQPAYTVANVAPKPIFKLQNSAQTICSGTRTNILFNTTITGSQLLLKKIRYNGVIGGAVTEGVSRFVDGQLLNHILTNNLNTNLTVEYEFEPLFGACSGEVITTSVTVVPSPKIDLTVANETICSGAAVRLDFSSANGTIATVNSVSYSGLTGGKVVKDAVFGNTTSVIETLLNNTPNDLSVTYSFGLKNGACVGSEPLVKSIKVLNKDSRLTLRLLEAQVCQNDNTEITPVVELGSGSVQSFEWNFGDGNSLKGSSNLETVTHKYNSIGTYTISLNVVSSFGCAGSYSKPISIYPLYKVNSTKSYFEDFEQLNTGWGTQKFDLIDNYFERSDSTSWRVKAPDGETIKGVSNAWWTGRNYTSEIQSSSANQFIKKSKSYYNNENSTLNSPCFFIEKSENQMISFNSFVDLQNNIDGVVLQYSVDDTNWANVGVNKEGWNWYTGVGITSRPGGQTTGPYGWTGNSTRKWRASKFSLNDNSFFNKNVRFRFAFSSDGSNPPNETARTLDGFALDDFFIGNKDGKVLIEQLINYNSFDGMLQNKFIDDLYDAELSLGSSSMNRISYHVSFPSLDSLNQSNPNDPGARSAYYGISSTPNTFLNGLTPLNIKSGASQLKVTVDSLSLKGSPFDLSLKASNGTSTSKLEIALLMTAKTSFNSPLLAYVGLVDKEIVYKINGKDTSKLTNVLRKLLLGADGRLIAQNWTKGQTLSVLLKDVEIDVPINNPNKLSLIAFLQDKNTKEIYQNISIAAPKVKPRLVTGLDESKDPTIFIFPNPASKQFQFTYFDAGEEWVLVNQIGSVVQSGKAIQTPNQLNTVNIEGLQNGVYFFKIHLKNKQAPLVRKLIVLN